jgi:hypothetical protein
MASVAYSLHQVSPAPLGHEREAPATEVGNSRAFDFSGCRAASAEGESVGSRHEPISGLDRVRTAASGGRSRRSGKAAEVGSACFRFLANYRGVQ